VKPGDESALYGTDNAASAQTHNHGRPQRPVIGGCDKGGNERRADGGDETYGKIDLAEQESEQLGRAE
jgi:hypothetical protein